MHYYKQHLNIEVYEEARNSLSLLNKRFVTDAEVECHYDELRKNMEKQMGYIPIEDFKELTDFSSQFKSYYDELTPEQQKEIGPCRDGYERRLRTMSHMMHHGKPVPTRFQREVNKYIQEKEFFTSLITKHGMHKEKFHDMFQEYREYRRENFPKEKSMSMREFREAIEHYAQKE